MMATWSPSCRGVDRSTTRSPILAATAALASRGPMASATAAAVAPSATASSEPSGRTTFMKSSHEIWAL